MSIFQRLGYNFNDPDGVVENLSNSAIKYLDTFPPIVNEQLTEDLSNNDANSYFKNPVANIVFVIRNTSNTLITLLSANTNTNTNAVTGITATINTIFINANTNLSNIATNTSGLFLIHTDRMSGVSSAGIANTDDLTAIQISQQPHLQTALGIGRVLLILTHQTDSVSNSAPVLGSFTSLFVANTLGNLSNSLNTFFDVINNSITVTGSGTGIDPFVRNSNLTLSTAQSIENTIIDIQTTMNTRREHDINFYANSQNVFSDLSVVNQFSQPGEVQKMLFNDFIGTPKLISRINE